MREKLMAGILAALVLSTGCLREPGRTTDADDKIDRTRVFVSILPQAYFVERVGGDNVEVNALVQPGQSPATYEPTPRQMVALGKSDVYFRIGVPFEAALMKKLKGAFKDLNVVDCRSGLRPRRMKHAHEHDDEAHHEEAHDDHDVGESEHGEHAEGMDPHSWLDPVGVKTQVQTICDELCRLDPAHAEEYRSNLEAFRKDLDTVHSRIAAILAPLKGRKFYVYHPAFGYFGDRYGLEQEPVEIEGKSPSAKQLSRLIKEAKADRVKVIFVQAQFSARSAETVAQAIGGAVVPIDPLARDYLKNLEKMAREIERALSPDRIGSETKGAAS